MRFLYLLALLNVSFIGSVLAQKRPSGPAVASVQPVLTETSKPSPVAAPTPSLAFKPDSVFVNPEVRPQFAGGEEGLRGYLMKNLHYPEQALRQHISGKVYVRFILSAAGRITDATVLRGPGSGLNEEALRLVWLMPAWQPAHQRGQAVRVSCTLPITFQE